MDNYLFFLIVSVCVLMSLHVSWTVASIHAMQYCVAGVVYLCVCVCVCVCDNGVRTWRQNKFTQLSSLSLPS